MPYLPLVISYNGTTFYNNSMYLKNETENVYVDYSGSSFSSLLSRNSTKTLTTANKMMKSNVSIYGNADSIDLSTKDKMMKGNIVIQSGQTTTGYKYSILTNTGDVFTVPPGVTSINAYCVGGGGGGGSTYEITYYTSAEDYGLGGGGGGGGYVAGKTIAVTPGEQFRATIGAGGAGGEGLWDESSSRLRIRGTYGGNGGTTSLYSIRTSSTVLTANGGNGGVGFESGVGDSAYESYRSGSWQSGGNGGSGGGCGGGRVVFSREWGDDWNGGATNYYAYPSAGNGGSLGSAGSSNSSYYSNSSYTTPATATLTGGSGQGTYGLIADNYFGSGGGGGRSYYGGSGGKGGPNAGNGSVESGDSYTQTAGVNGYGGGGGGGGNRTEKGTAGGSGAIIITW